MANRSHGRRFLGIGSSEVPTTRWADSDLLFGESPLVVNYAVLPSNTTIAGKAFLYGCYGGAPYR